VPVIAPVELLEGRFAPSPRVERALDRLVFCAAEAVRNLV
jgi:hypothetical protein